MALFHVFSEVENRNTGVPMSGVQVRVRFTGVDTLAPIYMDEAGTPFTPSNYCITDADGMYSFYVDSGEYDLDFLVGSQVIKTIGNFRPAEVGPTGPANSTYTTTNALENSDVANVSAILSESGKAGTFTIRDYPDFTAEVAADAGKVNYIRSVSDNTKVWVRTSILATGAAQTGAASGLTVDAELAAKATLSGVARTATNYGTFTGSTIPDNVSGKAAMQALETAVENTTGNAATKVNATAVGVAATDSNMGTYTGATIPDNQTAKQNIQALETAVEARPTSSDLQSLSNNLGGGLVRYSQASSYPTPSVAYSLKGFRNIQAAPYYASGDGVTDDTSADTGARSALKASGGGALFYPPAAGYLINGRKRHPGILIEDKDFPAFSGPEPQGAFRVYSVNKGEYNMGMAGVYSFMTSGTVNATPINTVAGKDSVALTGVVYSGSDVTNPVCVCNIHSRYAGLPPGINWGIEIDMNNESPTAYNPGDARGGQGVVLNTGSTYQPDTGIVIQRGTGEGTGPGWKQGVFIKGVRGSAIVVEAMSETSAPGMSPAATGTVTAFAARVGGDAQNRWILTESGKMSWGPGSSVVDTILERDPVGNGLSITGGLNASLNINAGGVMGAQQYWVGSNPVVGSRKTGWTADTGTAKRTANATYSGTAEAAYTQATIQALMNAVRDLSQTVKALKDDLISHGLIGA